MLPSIQTCSNGIFIIDVANKRWRNLWKFFKTNYWAILSNIWFTYLLYRLLSFKHMVYIIKWSLITNFFLWLKYDAVFSIWCVHIISEMVSMLSNTHNLFPRSFWRKKISISYVALTYSVECNGIFKVQNPKSVDIFSDYIEMNYKNNCAFVMIQDIFFG